MSWGAPNAPKGPGLGDEFTEGQRTELLRAMTGPVFLTHPTAKTVWAIRVNAAGDLELLASQTDRAYDVVATLTRAGAWSTAGAQNPAVGAATPGR